MATGHDHDRAEASVASERVRRWLFVAVGALAVATVAGVVLLRPSQDLPPLGDEFGFAEERLDATVRDVDVVPCANTDPDAGILCEATTFEVTSGSVDGEIGTLEQPIAPTSADLDEGDRVVLSYNPDLPEFIQYRFLDFQRDQPLLVLAAVFAVAVVALGRFQGLRALIGLAVSVAVLLGFVLPAILDGKSPVAVALFGSAMIAFVALYLTHGVNERSTIALLGAFGSLALTGLLASVFVSVSSITGYSSEDAGLLEAAGGQVDIRGLVLAGIVIGSLGVLDDVTVTQTSAVWQLNLANPRLGFADLYRSAIAIGRDHIASVVNTLVLAYAGAALPLLLIFSQADRPLSEWVTSELIAIEVIRTLVGSVGLIAAVPITTALASFVVARGGLRPERDDPVGDPPPAGDPPHAGARPPDVEAATAAADPGSAPASDPDWDQFAPDPDLDDL